MAIAIADSLLPNKIATPLDVRSVVANTDALSTIENPYVGMHVWINDPGKEVIVKTLKMQTVGVFSKQIIDTTENVPTAAEISALTSSATTLDTRISSLEISAGNSGQKTVTTQTFSSAPNNKVSFAGNVPVGIRTSAGNFYPVEKGSLIISAGTAVLDVTPYLAYDNVASFSGTWTAYFATGANADSVLDWIAPDSTRVTDIPAWNTVYQAADACWISVSLVGSMGAVLIGDSVSSVDSAPMGIYVGGETNSLYSFIYCPKGWYYKAFLSDATVTLSYSHKKVYKCKGGA